jgi:hypothetical protein
VEIVAGLIAALSIVGLGHATRQGRFLAFYSTVLMVIALVYVLFAALTGALRTIVIESAIASMFIAVAVAACRWGTVRTAGVLVATGLVAHGGYDLLHSIVVSNPVVPAWWLVFCGVVDVALGGWVFRLGHRGHLLALPKE